MVGQVAQIIWVIWITCSAGHMGQTVKIEITPTSVILSNIAITTTIILTALLEFYLSKIDIPHS